MPLSGIILIPLFNPDGAVYYTTLETTFGRQFIVQWDKVPLVSDPAARLTFEAILFETSNEIQFQYYSMADGQGREGEGRVPQAAALLLSGSSMPAAPGLKR